MEQMKFGAQKFDTPQFVPWPKIARLNRDCVITEKIDGTNACIVIAQHWTSLRGLVVPFIDVAPRGLEYWTVTAQSSTRTITPLEYWTVTAQSRTRTITPDADNYGFARWVQDNQETLIKDLGPGYHFGEWWGQGIQRKYGLDHKRFSLFNTTRWEGASFTTPNLHVVPVLYKGLFHNDAVDACIDELHGFGSVAAPGFKDPEGVVIYHTAANTMFKVTLKGDEAPKGRVQA